MDYQSWSKAYYEEAGRVLDRLALLGREGPSPDPRREQARRSRRDTLYAMYRDCRRTARYLERRALLRGQRP